MPFQLRKAYFLTIHFNAGFQRAAHDDADFPRTLMGVPRFYYSQLLRGVGKYLAQLVSSGPDYAFRQQMNVGHMVGTMLGYRHRRRQQPSMPMPLVSVIMPCYNGEAFLADAINSVLGQTFQQFELIVVDDGSTDRSAEILASQGDRIRVIRQANQGVSAARNAGIEAAQGEFIAFLDADDYWEPDFLDEMVKGMADPKTAIAYCGWQNVGVGQGKPYVPPNYDGADKMHHLLRFASLWPIHGILIRRSLMPAGVPFNLAYPACEDYDLWLRIASFHRIQLVPKVLAYYRKHGDANATSDQARAGYS